MEIGLLNWKEPGAFGPYIPSRIASGNGVVQALGFYEDGQALGAVVVEVGQSTVDILSLRYSTPPGVCEEALTRFLAGNAAGTDLQEIVYVAEGTEAELAELDSLMLMAGYIPRPSANAPAQARLETVLCQTAARQMIAASQGKPVYCLKDLPEVAVRLYNRSYPDNPIQPEFLDENTSRFCLLKDRIQGVLFTSAGEDGSLAIEWMANHSGQAKPLAWLLGSALSGAEASWPPETHVLLYGDEHILSLAETLGFQPAPDMARARTYTYSLR